MKQKYLQSRIMMTLLQCILLSMFLDTALATPGDLDTDFDSDGIVATDVGSDSSYALAIQTDGKILLGGFTDTELMIVRYNINGTLDTTFDGESGMGNGIVTTSLSGSGVFFNGLLIQPDDKILLSGRDIVNGFVLVRYNSDGTLDTTFDGDSGTGNGIVTTAAGVAIALQTDGKIILGGGSATGRYNINGSLDTSFGTNGIVNVAAGFDIIALAILPDGRILIGGNSDNGSDTDFALARYNSNGTLDASFVGDSGTGNGIVILDINDGNNDVFNAMAIQPDGKIVLGGTSGGPVMIRFNSDGTLDTSFDGDNGNGNGIVSWPVASGESFAINGLAVQPDGKILLGGSVYANGSDSYYTLWRSNANGTADTNFGGGDGRADVFMGTSFEQAQSIALQADGKIILGGYSYNGVDYDFAVLRYLANDFNDDGIAEPWGLTPDVYSFTDTADVATSSLQTSENITIAGLGTGITVPVIVIGGEFAINNGSYTNNNGYAQNGDNISVRHTASTLFGTSTDTVLKLGGLHATNNATVILGTTTDDTFTSTTLVPDTIPNVFSFTDQTGVALSTIIISDSITVEGINTPSSISVTNGEYSINSDTYTSTAGTVFNGDSVTVRHTSSGSPSTAVSTLLTIGTVSNSFTSTTAATVNSDSGGSLSWTILLTLVFPLLWRTRSRFCGNV